MQSDLGMQDKYSIGPVTIVQLVGLQAKPKIASAQVDAAVRAADAVPMSAAVRFSNDLAMPIEEISTSSHNLKAAPSLGLSVPLPSATISLEAGADRPVADANAPAPAIDPSAFDLLLQKLGLTAPVIGEQQPTPNKIVAPNVTSPVITDAYNPAVDDIALFDAPFDGAASFGDDQMIDFTLPVDTGPIDTSPTLPAAANAAASGGEFDHMLYVSITTDWTGDMSDVVGDPLPGPQINDHFAPNETAHSSSDAIPSI